MNAGAEYRDTRARIATSRHVGEPPMENTPERWASLPLRLALGIGCVHHGWHNVIMADERHAFSWMLQAIGVARPPAVLWIISVVSFIGGLALIAGAFVRPVSLALAVNVPAILLAIHWPSGFDYVKLVAVTAQGPQYGMPGVEISVLYLAGLLSLFIAGAGPLSCDARRRRRALRSASMGRRG